MSWNERMESSKDNVYTLSQGRNKSQAIKPGIIDTKHGSFGSSALITQLILLRPTLPKIKKAKQNIGSTLVEQIVHSFSPDLLQAFEMVS